MAKYTRKQAELGIRFWKKALNEAIAAESEEDQKKEENAEETEDTGTEKDAGAEETGIDDVGTEEAAGDDAFPPADENADGTDAKIAELEARIAELEAKLGGAAAGENETSDEDVGFEEDAEDDSDEDDSEESDDEDSNDDDDNDDDDDSDDDDDEDSDDDGEELDESKKYAPNTVGAVIQLLEKFDLKSQLMIRMNPGKYTCMPIDVSGKTMVKGHGCTYMDIAKGNPKSKVNESKTVKKTAKKPAKKADKK